MKRSQNAGQAQPVSRRLGDGRNSIVGRLVLGSATVATAMGVMVGATGSAIATSVKTPDFGSSVGSTTSFRPTNRPTNSDIFAPNQVVTTAHPIAQRRALPRLVNRAVRLDAARRSGKDLAELRITDYKAEVWPDGCLGLGSSEEICTQSLVSGWQVQVSHDDQTWLYRSNAAGRMVRLEAVDGVAVSAKGAVSANGTASQRSNRGFIGGDSTSTAPLPEDRQPPSAQLTPLGVGGQVRITLSNRTNATITYQVIGDTTQRSLGGQSSVVLRLLDVPTTVTFRRDDGGLLNVITEVGDDPNALAVTLDTTVDLGRDRTTLTVEPTGEVFLN